MDLKTNHDDTTEQEMATKIHRDTLTIVSSKPDADVKPSFYIHTHTEDTLQEFFGLLDAIMSEMELDISHVKLEDIEPVYVKKKYVPAEGWRDLPMITYNDDVLKSPVIKLSFVLTKAEFKQLQKLWLTTFSQTLYETTTERWFPDRLPSLRKNNQYWIDDVKNRYPIYIISKGRWEKRFTSKYFDWAGLDYKIVVEPQEYDEYAKVIDPKKILVLPPAYLGLNQGGIPARNFVLHHSRANGDKRHWICDDNIMSYQRFTQNKRVLVKGGSTFRVVEDYCDRFTNVKLAGHQYKMFVIPNRCNLNEYIINTRIYSSILISNDIQHEWRGRYNEDTDLSLRVLKDGNPTLLFNGFIADKQKTLCQKGGNTDSIYVEDGVKLKAESIVAQHPDVAKVTERFGRVHHQVNYKKFKANALIPAEHQDPPVEYNLRLSSDQDPPFDFWTKG